MSQGAGSCASADFGNAPSQSSQKPRSLVFVRGPLRSRMRDAVAELEGNGVEVHVADSMSDLVRLTTERAFVGALVDLGGDHGKAGYRQALEILDAVPTCQILALVDFGEGDKRELADLVYNRVIHDFHTLPADMGRLAFSIGHMAGLARLSHARELGAGGGEGDEPHMLGRCPAMREVFVSIRRVASVDLPVLVTGESGTGKELVAQAIHERSAYRDGPFVAINCAGLSSTLIQSELFGHEKGAFTGAHQRKPGKLETAHGGTCFLDEIGDFPAEVQGNLLRFLQEGTIERVGSNTPIPVNTRIVAATNVDLEKAMEQGKFRADLFYRLNGIQIRLPPLRERGDDIELIATYSLRRIARELRRPVTGFRPDAVAAIAGHPWHGNVRELISSIRRAVVMASSNLVTPADLGLVCENGTLKRLPRLEEARAAAERRLLNDALVLREHNVVRAARDIGVSRMTFYRLMNKHNMQVGNWQSSESQAPEFHSIDK